MQEREKEKKLRAKRKREARLCRNKVGHEAKLKSSMDLMHVIFADEIQNRIAMKKDYNTIKAMVGTTNVTITSELRYSELRSLVEQAAILKEGILTIKVSECTLTTSEITGLAKLGGPYVALDLTEC